MEFQVVPALVAGFGGTVVMTVMMMMGKSMGMTTMDIALIAGGMVSGDERKAQRAGMFIHFIVMGTVIFGLLYALVFQAVNTASWAAGVVVGLVHGGLVGFVGMPMIGAVHPRMQPATEGFHLASPGVMGVNYGKGTPMGLVMGHVVYGLVVALIYSALI